MAKIKITSTYIVLLFLSHLLFVNCTSRDRERNENKENNDDSSSVKTELEIRKATYYIENSLSMFGYVSDFTEYVYVVSELAEKPEFVEKNVEREFNFINGGDPLQITPIGNEAASLRDMLNTEGYNCGDVTRSNLNAMFQVALENAGDDSISILISDAIYDIGRPGAPFNALAVEGNHTRSEFIGRLQSANLQTIMIKLYSQFIGRYFYTSKEGNINLNQQRPYYIWIIGENELLNRYFSDHYLTQNLNGYEAHVRYLIVEDYHIPYQVTQQNQIGRFRFNRQNKNKLIDAEKDSHDQGFQFSIAVDYSVLPFANSFLESVGNYSCSGDYKVTNVEVPRKRLHGLSFTPTHLITVFTEANPLGYLEVTLNNAVPAWINETDTDTESNMELDTTHTFGFQFLTNGITNAYKHMNEERQLATFNIIIED